jgi:hypothetical protein
MATRFFYIGGMGPYLYDDEDTVTSDEYGYADGERQRSFQTDGAINTTKEPEDDGDMMSLGSYGLVQKETFSATGTISKGSNVILVSGDGYDLFLPTLADGSNRKYHVKNIGVGTVTLKPNSGDAGATLEGLASVSLGPGSRTVAFCDSADWWSI